MAATFALWRRVLAGRQRCKHRNACKIDSSRQIGRRRSRLQRARSRELPGRQNAWSVVKAGAAVAAAGSRSCSRHPAVRGPNWPSVGSAQQNHGSVSRGLPSVDRTEPVKSNETPRV